MSSKDDMRGRTLDKVSDGCIGLEQLLGRWVTVGEGRMGGGVRQGRENPQQLSPFWSLLSVHFRQKVRHFNWRNVQIMEACG